MGRLRIFSSMLAASAALFVGCESTQLYVQPEPPDAGFVDAAIPPPPPDAGFEEPPPARESVYIHTGTTLYSYDPVTNDTTYIGDFRTAAAAIDGMVDIAIDLDGRMFGGTRDREIYVVDPETALCRFAFAFDDLLHGMTFLSDGRLVVAGDRISIVNPTTGAVFRELLAGNQYQTSGDIVGLPDGKLYWTVRNNNGQGDGVVRVDPSSGSPTWLDEASVERLYGLGYADGALYGFSSDGVVVTIDPENGHVMELRPLDGRWWGATTNPVRW